MITYHHFGLVFALELHDEGGDFGSGQTLVNGRGHSAPAHSHNTSADLPWLQRICRSIWLLILLFIGVLAHATISELLL